MAVKTRAELKAFFLPFFKLKLSFIEAWFDSFVHVNDANVEQSQTLLNVRNLQEVVIPANSFLTNISIIGTSGTPAVTIGTTEGGNDIKEMEILSGFSLNITQLYVATETTFYITIASGYVNIRFDYKTNLF